MPDEISIADMPSMHAPENESSQVHSVGFTPHPNGIAGDLFIRFYSYRGGKKAPAPVVYRYPNCLARDADAIRAAESAGKFVGTWKVDHPDFKKLEIVGEPEASAKS